LVKQTREAPKIVNPVQATLLSKESGEQHGGQR